MTALIALLLAAASNAAAAGDVPTSLGSAETQRADAQGGLLALIQSIGGASDLTATANRAEGGDASSFGGLGLGGAILIEESPGVVALRSTRISHNAATGGFGRGGAVFSTDSVLTVALPNLRRA